MAATAVVLKFLAARRRGDLTGSANALNVETPNSEAVAQRDLAENEPLQSSKVASSGSLNGQQLPPEEEKKPDVDAALRIQRIWRGHSIRKELAKVLPHESKLSGKSIQQSLDLVLDWYDGWVIQFAILALLIVCIVTTWFQIFDQTPSIYNSDSSFLARVQSFDRSGVVDSTTLYPLMSEIIDHFDNSYDVELDPRCEQALAAYCPFNETTLQLEYNNSVDTLISMITLYCPSVSPTSGYVDASRRVVGTMYMTQTRRKPAECATRMLQIDPYVGNTRTCLSLDEEDDVFSPPPPADCKTCFQFEMDPEQKLYAMAFQGSAFNLPKDFMKCRVEQLQTRRWLDHRSKNVCILATVLDMEQNGRLLAYSECFFFDNGGKVQDIQRVDSISLFAHGYATSYSLTIFSLVCVILHQLSLCKRYWRTKRKFLTKKFGCFLAGATIEMTAHIMFLVHVSVASSFTFQAQVQNGVLFRERLAFLDDFNRILHIAEEWRVFTIMSSIGIFILLINTLICLEFHPSSAIVGGVIKQAASGLYSFLFVYAIFVGIYAFIGMILFSRTSLRFSTYGGAINSLLMLALGEIEEIEYSISDPTHPTRIATLQSIYFWVYIVLVTILLMNILLAIIVGAFVEMSERANRGAPMLTLGRSFAESARFCLQGLWVRTQRALLWGKRGEELKTPNERLLKVRKQYRIEGTSAIQLRAELSQIFYSAQTVEYILNRCRSLTNYETFKPKEIFLRGMDGNSEALKGHSLSLLEAIETRQVELLAGQHQLQHYQRQIQRALGAKNGFPSRQDNSNRSNHSSSATGASAVVQTE